MSSSREKVATKGMAAPPDSKADKSPEEHLCAAAAAGNKDDIAELISSGADVTYFDASGMTPLMHAAAGGHAAATRLLLDAGAPWNALSPSGLSAGDLTSDPTTYDLLLDHALRSELILGTVARRQAAPANSSAGAPAESYLDSRVSFSEDRVMDADSKAVMMEWERPLMEAHARAICSGGGGKVLNVGFGMGLVDQAIQKYEPEEHTIIEAHPEVYARMLKLGWGEKKNVRILFGRWQDVLPQLGSYDGITKSLIISEVHCCHFEL
jgi:protein arginine N-methyltransferase 2